MKIKLAVHYTDYKVIVFCSLLYYVWAVSLVDLQSLVLDYPRIQGIQGQR